MSRISHHGDGTTVILDQPTHCPACNRPMPTWAEGRDQIIWWQEPTDKPRQFRMVYYHRACGVRILAESERIICWAGCQREIRGSDRAWVDPDADGNPQFMHAKCAGERGGLMVTILDELNKRDRR